jgi:hypothetical protein
VNYGENAGNRAISVFDISVGGDIPPARRITSPQFTRESYGLAYSPLRHELFQGDLVFNSPVRAFSAAADGPTSPVREFSDGTSALDRPWGIAVDDATGELFVGLVSDVRVYDVDATGVATPVRTLNGVSNYRTALTVDRVHGELWVLTADYGVFVYALNASGPDAPIRQFTWAESTSGVYGMFVDTLNDEVVITGCNGGAIQVFARTAVGFATPLRTITGPNTQLSSCATGVLVDTRSDEIIALNYDNSNVTIYPRAANGDVPPLRTIGGANSQLEYPSGIAFCR